MRPNYGNIVSLDNKQLVTIDEDTQYNYKYTGQTVVATGGIRCATFVDDKGTVYMQPWSRAGFFKRKGEKNLMAQLNNNQVIEMVTSFYKDKAKVADLAIKYDITERHAYQIVSGHAWRHITLSLIRRFRTGASVPMVAANRPIGRRKLSATIVPFIRKDSTNNKMSVKQLAIKYCVSESQIRRILAGQAWRPDVTASV